MPIAIEQFTTAAALGLIATLRDLADFIELNGPTVYRNGEVAVDFNYSVIGVNEITGEKHRTMHVKADIEFWPTPLGGVSPHKGLKPWRCNETREIYRWDGQPQRAPKKGEFYRLDGEPYVSRARRDLKRVQWIMEKIS